MNVKGLRALCAELYKTINKLNPNFMRDLSKLRVIVNYECRFRLIIVYVNIIYALLLYYHGH